MNSNNRQFNLSRRNSLKFVAGAIGTGILAARAGADLAAPEPAIAQNDSTPDAALQKLMDGNKRFVDKKRQSPNQDFGRLTEVAKTQKPFAAILGCADSRFPSEIIFDQGLGDLFVCRVAGNVATPEEIGSLEFGTLVLGAKVLVVIGHKRCGAVDATIKGAQVPGQIGSLLDAIKPAVESSKNQTGDKLENASKANVVLQANKLKASPVISKLIEENKLKVVGGYYDLDTGTVTILSES
ncbi:carbonic anhydrase [Microcoleus vaginatus PCC 9802]|uniref:carbonic anhydrase n=1 Tax=Microcoleus vaginatus TaxID=119532 RepID=UPI00020D2B04|nr:carbonic anhydrase [Microcoleus vaginatus FGP-2]UNU19842.1 carbonic anhydrase [Microcoleus vaginatus PCC 9802]